MRLKTLGLKRLFINEDGATSVLVILMVIVLVSLGYFAIASANSNIKLSNRAIEWNVKYYGLDAQGEAFVADVDNMLYNAQILSQEYLDLNSYEQLTHKNLPIDFHSSMYYGYIDATDKDMYKEFMMESVYLYYAEIELKKLEDKYPDMVMSTLKDGSFVQGIICDLTFTDSQNPEFHMDVSLTVRPVRDFLTARSQSDFSISRYKITSWVQWQNQAEMQPGTGIWDGIIKKK